MNSMNRLTSRDFWLAAAARAIRTMAQTFLATVGTSTVTIYEVRWDYTLGATALAGLLSIVTSIATGLPELGDSAEEDDLL